MTKENYSRNEVIEIIDKILQHPDILRDATINENTDWEGESLLDLVDTIKEQSSKLDLDELKTETGAYCKCAEPMILRMETLGVNSCGICHRHIKY